MIEQYGIHRVQCGDIMHGVADLMGQDRARILYSDPPWGDGNLKFWATLNKKMTGNQNIPTTTDKLLKAVFGVAKEYVTDFVLIEYGIRWFDMVRAFGIEAGLTPMNVVRTLYKGGGKLLPLDLHVFAVLPHPLPLSYYEAIYHTVGLDTCKKAIYPLAKIIREKYPNETPVIIDPCCGMGYTAQMAIECGFAFRGNELNRARLQKTINRITK